MHSVTEILTMGEHSKLEDIFLTESMDAYYFKNQKKGRYGSENVPCYTFENNTLESQYYIGVDWLCKLTNRAIYISPKLNKNSFETDYLKMLLICLKDSEASKYIGTIYEIKINSERIEIDQTDDLLSPLLAIEFLNLVKQLVKKGLKKSYYREERHLNARVKGKLLVSQTLKQYTFKKELHKTICAYDVFGLNHPENQLIKAALLFVQKYLAQYPDYALLASNTLNYCLPAFNEVVVPKDISALRHFKSSPFFSTYKEALSIAKIILERFGHNVRSIQAQKIKTQPYWINMALLFELYTFTLLRKQYTNNVLYQYKSDYQELDFLINSGETKMVVDTKYKAKYGNGKKDKNDIRQLSGYARMEKVYNHFGKNKNEVIDCLIIYPIKNNDGISILELKIENKEPIKNYVGFYKVGVGIPYFEY